MRSLCRTHEAPARSRRDVPWRLNLLRPVQSTNVVSDSSRHLLCRTAHPAFEPVHAGPSIMLSPSPTGLDSAPTQGDRLMSES